MPGVTKNFKVKQQGEAECKRERERLSAKDVSHWMDVWSYLGGPKWGCVLADAYSGVRRASCAPA